MSPPWFGRGRSLDDSTTLADRLLLVENIVGTHLPRIASLENKLSDVAANFDRRLRALENMGAQPTPASHRGQGAFVAERRPAASTTLFDLHGL